MKGGRERDIDLLFHLFMHSLVDSCMCPDRGSNTQPWHTGMMLYPTELPRQGENSDFKTGRGGSEEWDSGER